MDIKEKIQAEAENRYISNNVIEEDYNYNSRKAFIDGAEWLLSEIGKEKALSSKDDEKGVSTEQALSEALEYLMQGVRELPPLTAIEGVLIPHYKKAEAALALSQSGRSNEQEAVKLLSELVRLKDIKDELDLVVEGEQDQEFVNRYAQYRIDKVKAWKSAKELLNRTGTAQDKNNEQ